MTKSILVNVNRPGRPATGQDPVLAVRLPADLTRQIDEWAEKRGAPTRSDAIRRLVELGLSVKPKARPRAQDQKDRARELAGKAIDKMADADASSEDKAVRKQRLIKGPSMVREMRVDRPKTKE